MVEARAAGGNPAPVVMHVIDTAGPGGAETVFAQLAQRMGARQTRSLTIVPREDWLTLHLRTLNLEPVILPAKGSLNVAYLRALLKLVRTNGVRLIHTHLLGSAVYGALTGLIARIPVIAVLHGPTDLRAVGAFRGVKRWLLLHGCSALVAVSTSTRQAMIDFGVPPESITLIRNGVDTDEYTPGTARDLKSELGLPEDALLVAAVGNIRTPKAYDVLMDAAALVLERVPRACFAVIGEGNETQMAPLLARHAKLGLGSRFRFLGFRRSTAQLFRNFDVFVSSSRSEGLSLSFLEAMACGRAVVATRSGGPQEVIEDGHSGLLVPIEDPAALASALERALLGDALRQQLGAAARERVARDFSMQATVAQYDELYRKLIGRTGAST